MSPDVCAPVPPGCPAGDGMTALIWFGVLAVYVAGLFPAAVRVLRWMGSMPTCHGGYSPRDRDCLRYHRGNCWRADGPEIKHLIYMWLAVIWPLTLLAVTALRRASKVPPATADLQRQIDDLESQLGMDR